MTDFCREVDSAVAGALNPGEHVIWTGHCVSRLGKQRYEHRPTLLAMVLGLTVSSLFVVAGGRTLLMGLGSGPISRVIGGAIPLAIGVAVMYVLIIGLFRDSKMFCRRQTAYVLTDQRAFVLKQCRTEVPMRSADWRYVDDVRIDEVGSEGRGTVQFLSWDPVERRWVHALRFFMVSDARSVEAQAIAARDAART